MGRRTRHPAHTPVPTVNLLSPWVFEAMATRRLRRRFVVAGCALVLLLGAGWSVQHLRVGQAEQVLTVEQAETARLTAQTQELAPVRAFVAAVDQQKVTVQEAMRNEVYLSRVLSGLDDATPGGARVESVAVTVTPPAETTGATGATDPAATGESSTDTAAAPAPSTAPTVSPCPGPDPFNTRVVVGCITLSGSADSRATVGKLVINLGGDKLFVEPFISTTTTADGDAVMFTGSVGLSTKAFSKRYAALGALLRKGDL